MILKPAPLTIRQHKRRLRIKALVWLLAFITVALVAVESVRTAGPNTGTNWLGLGIDILALGTAGFIGRRY